MDPASGGPCQGIRNSNPAMMHLGVYREVVCLDDPSAPFIGMDDFPVHALGPGRGPWHYSAKLKPWLLTNLYRFDVVVINGLWLYSSYAGWSALRQLKRDNLKQGGVTRNVPNIFIMPHGMLDPYFQRAPDRKLKALRNWFYWKLIENRVVNDADALLFTCEVELQLAGAAFSPYHPKNKINVGYGIISPPDKTPAMLAAFEQKCPGLAGEPFYLFLSRIHEKKGVDLLIKAYVALFNKAGEQGYTIPKLIIAGPGVKTAYGRKMLFLASASPELRKAIIFPGMLTGDAKWGALYNCETFILPSHQENFGIAVVEALACSKPVLISNQVNIWMEIQTGGGGLVDDDTLEGATNILQKWRDLPPAKKQKMGEDARQVFLDHFDVANASAIFFKAISKRY
jgi:glycosyltransferase involved in cell wall biosynthesis